MKIIWYIDTKNKLDFRKRKNNRIFYYTHNKVLKPNIIDSEISFKEYDIFCNALKKIKI
jgi:hypothetical protein